MLQRNAVCSLGIMMPFLRPLENKGKTQKVRQQKHLQFGEG
jgi:hypothetical protein